MAENVLLEINPVLLEALELPGDSGKVNYFQLLGLSPETSGPADVDKAVMAKSRALRAWQNSPQHGAETQKLLPMLHRIAAVLKDPRRREAYAQEVSRILSGEGVNHLREFQEMVRAALSDGVIDAASKAELLRYATSHSIPQAEAGRILNEITAAMERKPDAAASGWEFRLAEGEKGAGAFRATVQALLEGSAFNSESRARLVAEAPKFGILPQEAASILEVLTCDYFRELAGAVARGGVLSDNQAKLLMPKARNFGIEQSKAFEILSAFTFTGASEQDIATLNLSSVGFDSNEITNILSRQQNVLYRRRKGVFSSMFGALMSPALITGVVVIGGIGAGAYFFTQFGGGGAAYPTTTAAATPTPKPTAVPVWEKPSPDPADGHLAVAAAGGAGFKIKITEVTCGEYQKFLKAMFYPNRPPGWEINYDFPTGQEKMPVTGVGWEDAKAFCAWKARELGLPVEAVRLPTLDEFKAVLAAPARGGAVAGQPKFWSASGMSGLTAKAESAANKAVDALYLEGGQVYDLLGNVAEWGSDEKGGQRIVLGGDHTQAGESYDPLQPQWRDPASADDKTGFRYVIVSP